MEIILITTTKKADVILHPRIPGQSQNAFLLTAIPPMQRVTRFIANDDKKRFWASGDNLG